MLPGLKALAAVFLKHVQDTRSDRAATTDRPSGLWACVSTRRAQPEATFTSRVRARCVRRAASPISATRHCGRIPSGAHLRRVRFAATLQSEGQGRSQSRARKRPASQSCPGTREPGARQGGSCSTFACSVSRRCPSVCGTDEPCRLLSRMGRWHKLARRSNRERGRPEERRGTDRYRMRGQSGRTLAASEELVEPSARE